MGITATQHETRLPVPIAKMDPWSFWARHDALGLPADVVSAINDGTATPEQQQMAKTRAEWAKQYLLCANGVYPERKTS